MTIWSALLLQRSRVGVTAVNLGFHYVRVIYCPAERSLASQDGLCFMKLVIFYRDRRTYENFDPLTL